MERIWRLYRYWRQAGNFNQQNPPVFHLYIDSYYGLACHYLHGAGVLEKYEEVYLGCEEKSMVLSLIHFNSAAYFSRKNLLVKYCDRHRGFSLSNSMPSARPIS